MSKHLGQKTQREIKEASDHAGRGIRKVGEEVEGDISKVGNLALKEVEAAAKKGVAEAEKAGQKVLEKALALTAKEAFSLAIKVIKVAAPETYTASLGPFRYGH